jgi:hypothetical protein
MSPIPPLRAELQLELLALLRGEGAERQAGAFDGRCADRPEEEQRDSQ